MTTTVQTYFMDVYDFHRRFDLPRPAKFKPLSYDLFHFRKQFMQEELDEFVEAYQQQDHAKVLDALVDLVYVALGTAVMMGVDFNAAWTLVHEANMAKLRAKRAEESKRGTTYDVVKPPGWLAPDLSHLVK